MYDHERVIHHQSKILVLSFSVLFLEKEIRKKKEKGEKEKKEKRKKKKREYMRMEDVYRVSCTDLVSKEEIEDIVITVIYRTQFPGNPTENTVVCLRHRIV